MGPPTVEVALLLPSGLIVPTVSQKGEAPLEVEVASAVVVGAAAVHTVLMMPTIKVPRKAIWEDTMVTSQGLLKIRTTMVVSMQACKANTYPRRIPAITMKDMEIMKVRSNVTSEVEKIAGNAPPTA